MNIKPIKSDRDYRSVLKAIDALMNAKTNSPQGDKLDVLVTLAEAWEENTTRLKLPIQYKRLNLPWSSEAPTAETWNRTLAAVPGSPKS